MASKVKGSAVNVYKHNSETDEDIIIACSKECTLNLSTSFIDVTNYASDGFTQSKPDLKSWSVTGSGFIILDNYSYLLMRQDWYDNTLLSIKFVVDNGVDGFAIVNGSCYIESLSESGTFGDMAQYQVSFKGTGAVSFSGTQPDPTGVIIVNGDPVMFKQYTATGGETTITYPDMVGKTLFNATRSTGSFGEIVTTGSVPFDGLLWNSLTGQITIGSAYVPGEFSRFIFQ